MTLFRPKEVRLDSRLLVSRGNALQRLLSFLFILVIILVLAKFAIFKPTITGLITVREEINHTDAIGLTIDSNTEYYWFLTEPGNLKSLKLDGSVTIKGSAKVYVEHNNRTYLVFDSSQLSSGIGVITGAVVLDNTTENQIIIDGANQTINEITEINQTEQTNNQPTETVNNETVNNKTNQSIETINNQTTNETQANETSPEVEKTITISLAYNSGTIFDADDDGTESVNGIIDFTVENSGFSWQVDESLICTKLETYNINTSESTTVCYGNSDCCSFVGLAPTRDRWNDVFYSSYGRYGAGLNNLISAQIIYYNVSLNVEQPYADIITSSLSTLDAKYYFDEISFKDECVETCLLSGFNESFYKLIIEVNDSILTIDNIKYSIVQKINITENISINIKDKKDKKIGHYKLEKNEGGDYDLNISSLPEKAKGKKSEIKIKNIKNLEEIKTLDAYVDASSDDRITTDVVFVSQMMLMDNATVTLAKKGNVNKILKCENKDFDSNAMSCSNWQATSIDYSDRGDVIEFTVNEFSAYAGAEIEIINVHSYPSLYGNWTVMFNTTGTANLTITAVNSTIWTNYYEEGYDLKFLEVRCGDNILSYGWFGDSVFIANHSCNETAYEISKVLTAKVHILRFIFGSQEAYAYNSVPGAESSESGTDEWRMFHRFLNHTGYTNSSAPANISNANVITYTTSGDVISSPTVADGFVYVGSDDGRLYQFNASNVSQLIASYATGNYVRTSPAVADGFVYVGNIDGNVFQLNSSNVSQLIASYATGGSTDRSSPAVADGYVYIGSKDFVFYQLNATNISKQIANYTTDGWVLSSPAVANGFVYVGHYGNWKLYQFNASNVSQLISSYTASNSIGYSSPAVADGFVYVGSYDSKLYQLNASNVSKLIASYTAGSTVDSSPAVADGFVYVGSNDKSLYQLNASNVSKYIANFTTGNVIASSPAVANGFVYVGSKDNSIYQLNASNISKLIANYTTSGQVQSSPAVANGYVYIGSDDNKLYQFGIPDTTPPSINFTAPTTQSGGYLQNWISANVTATDSNLDAITVYLYNTTGLVQSNSSSASPLFINFTNLQGGTYYLNASANDTRGNLNNTETRTITLGCNPPNIGNWTINQNVNCTGIQINLSGNLIINTTGNLILTRVNLTMMMADDGSNFINKTPNGGLWIYNSTIASNNSDYEYDFWVYGSGGNDNFTLQNSNISDAGYGSGSQGIQLYNISNVVVSNNNISGGSQYGLYLQYSTNNNITNNTIITNGTSGYGVYLFLSSNSILLNNIINTTGSSSHGILLNTSSKSNTLSNNIISTNGSNGNGIYLFSNSDNNTIQNNTITTTISSGNGIYLDTKLNSNIIQYNTITTAGIGIYLYAGVSNVISNNTITTSGNYAPGIYLQPFSGAPISNLTVSANTITTSGGFSYGIEALNFVAGISVNNTLSGNIITTSGGGGHGIFLDAGSSLNITSNRINATGANADGINIQDNSDSNIFNSNNIIQSSRDAFRFSVTGSSYPENNNLTNNNISNIAGYDIIFATEGINGTHLNDQPINNYSFTGAGSTLYFKDSSFGEIYFFKPVNGTGTNLSRDILITNNSAFVNSTTNSGLNRTANITLYSIGDRRFSNPAIFIDGAVCNGCYNFTSLTADTVVFNVSGFTNYSIGDSAACNPPANGNWSIGADKYIICKNRTITLNGNLTILGNLTFQNVTLQMNSSYNGEFVINNSGMFIINSSNLTAVLTNGSGQYEFWNLPNSQLEIYNTDIGYLGHNNATRANNMQMGLFISTNNSIIKDNRIVVGAIAWNLAIKLYQANNNTLANNTITTAATRGYGIYLVNADKNSIISNNISTLSAGTDNFSYGIRLESSNNNNITSNIFATKSSRSEGISLSASSYNSITNNNITAIDADSLSVAGTTKQHYNNSIDTTNNAEGETLYYYFDADSIAIENKRDVGLLYIAYANNITIRNNTLDKEGTRLEDVRNSVIANNTISTNAINDYGIYLLDSFNNNITNNNITTSDDRGYGIYLKNSTENRLSSNNITTLANGVLVYAWGISLENGSNNNNISSSIITTRGHQSYCIYSDSNNSFFEDIDAIATYQGSGMCIYLSNSNNNTFRNSRINATSATDIYIVGEGNNILVNTTFNQSDIGFASGATGSITVRWYLDTHVNDTAGNNVSNANVSGYNVSGDFVFSSLTGATGWITRQALTGYMQNATSQYFQTNYTINTTKDGTSNKTQQLNLTQSTTLHIQLNYIPTIIEVNLTSSDNLNRTNGTLIGSFSYNDSDDGTTQQNETGWYNNSVEVIALANLTSVNPANTGKGENWTFSVRVYDRTDWSNWVNSTSLTIQNAEVIFNKTIINITWNENTNLINNLTLSNYFYDIDNDNLSYNVTGNSSIRIIINQTTSNVSLHPTANWDGTETVYFTASDGQYSVVSNNITLTVINIPRCGDGSCDSSESCSSCSTDCGSCPATTGAESTGACYYSWVCSEWSPCVDGKETRSCTNKGTCPDTWKTPETERECQIKFTKEETEEETLPEAIQPEITPSPAETPAPLEKPITRLQFVLLFFLIISASFIYYRFGRYKLGWYAKHKILQFNSLLSKTNLQIKRGLTQQAANSYRKLRSQYIGLIRCKITAKEKYGFYHKTKQVYAKAKGLEIKAQLSSFNALLGQTNKYIGYKEKRGAISSYSHLRSAYMQLVKLTPGKNAEYRAYAKVKKTYSKLKEILRGGANGK